MTLINEIRKRSGLMIGVVAGALFLFILGDLFNSNTGMFRSDDRVVGEIGGEEIKLQEFSQEFERVRSNYYLQTGQNPPESALPGLRQQAWNELVFKRAFQQEFDKLGLEVTEAEMIDMVQGNNIHPSVAASFTNPETGEVDRAQIKSFLANLNSYDPNAQVSWYNFEQSLGPDRLRSKYEGLLANSYYVTEAEAKREYNARNTQVDFRYLYVPYSSIPDSTVEFSDSELRTYFNEHQEDFEQDANRTLQYLAFPYKATQEDISAIQEELASLRMSFKTTSNDSAFIDANSDGINNFIDAGPANVPSILPVNELAMGEVYGPFREAQQFKMYKVLDVTEDTIYSARARHILFQAGEEDQEARREARTKANEILREILNGADFAAMAREHGSDGTSTRGGDLGWFTEGTMVDKFNDVVMEATSTGLVTRLIETQFGYHIIDVTELPTRDKYLIGSIQKDIAPSDETIESVYRKAARFTQYASKEEIEVNLDSTQILLQALSVPPDARFINNLSGSRIRQIVTWAYSDDTNIGEVSDIFDLDDQYVIAILTGKQEKGDASFDAVKERVEPEAVKAAKRDKIVGKLKELGGTLEDISSAYGAGASINDASDITLSSASLPSVGAAPEAIGAAFSLAEGERSQPIAENNGVIILELTSKDEAAEVADYSVYKNEVAQRLSRSVSFKISQALEDFYNVEEEIYKYY